MIVRRQTTVQGLIESLARRRRSLPAAPLEVSAPTGITDSQLAKPTLAGSISGAGAVVNGKGFTAKKIATGQYQITLEAELPTNGVLIANATEFNRVPRPSAPAKKVFTIAFVSLAEAAADTAFSFMIKAS
jgi:hypothetical protein